MQERRAIMGLKCPIMDYSHEIELYFNDEEALNGDFIKLIEEARNSEKDHIVTLIINHGVVANARHFNSDYNPKKRFELSFRETVIKNAIFLFDIDECADAKYDDMWMKNIRILFNCRHCELEEK